MTTLADTLTMSLKQVGQAFLLAYYLPAVIFVQMHLQLLLPIWRQTIAVTPSDPPGLDMPAVTGFDFTAFAAALLIPFLVGIALVGLNDVLIRIFEGKFWWLRYGILYPLTWFRRRRCRLSYATLVALQNEYRRVSDLAVRQVLSGKDELDLVTQLDGLALQVNDAFREIESRQKRQRLPHAVERVMPTSFGNAFAVAEEYAYERYGMDAVLFWPRLNELISDNAPNQADRLARRKTSLDLSLNLAAISGILTFEFAVTAYFGPGQFRPGMLLAAAIALLSYLAFYNTAVNAVHKLGQLIMSTFDFQRSLLAEAFGLSQPEDLIVEQVMWVWLAVFLRRGAPFYSPESRGLNQLQQVRLGDRAARSG